MQGYRYKIFFFLGILSCLGLGGCDAIYRLLDEQGAEEKVLVGEVTPFENNPKVEEVQTLLNLYGYDVGVIDGILGLRTRNAIERFQKDNGLDPSRFADNATWEKLCVFKDNGLIVDQKLNNERVQALLKKAGFDPGPIDGKVGAKTKNAVMAFQKAKGLKVDGKVGYRTLSALAKYLSDNPQSK
ncbi:MAG TPA: peptidoglycan-binding protein [Candidatus Omnitrophota bacterium]|nr:peptidoglycan-binding protein [Candidatus Omnitrophota bacterium]